MTSPETLPPAGTTTDDVEPGPGASGRAAARGRDQGIGSTAHDVARDLRRVTSEVRFPLALDGSDEAAASRDRLLVQLDEHLLPRLKELSSPALVVLAGSTGAGKSTLYNSILGQEVSVAGVLRPTTRRPVLAYNPLDEDVLTPGPVTEGARLVPHPGVPRGVAFVDAPDLDSLITDNRETAAQLLEAADLWLFATTAARYGDALPWQTLARARERGASVAIVLNRVPRKNLVTVRGDLLQRLRDHGMDNVPLFVVPDVGPHEGMLDPEHVAPVARWLQMLGGADRSRSVIVRTLKGALAALPAWVTTLTDALETQADAARALGSAVDAALPPVMSRARASLRSGVVGAGPLASVWAHNVSAASVDHVRVRGGEARSSRRRGRAREQSLDVVRDALRSAAAASLVAAGSAADDALRNALTGPAAPPGGASLVTAPGDPEREAARASLAASEVDAWLARADAEVDRLLAADADGAAAAAVRALGARGLATVLAAAGAGSGDAERLAARVLAGGETSAAGTLRDDLADRASTVVDAEAAPIRDALADPALQDDAAAGLSVRLAELRRLA